MMCFIFKRVVWCVCGKVYLLAFQGFLTGFSPMILIGFSVFRDCLKVCVRFSGFFGRFSFILNVCGLLVSGWVGCGGERRREREGGGHGKKWREEGLFVREGRREEDGGWEEVDVRCVWVGWEAEEEVGCHALSPCVEMSSAQKGIQFRIVPRSFELMFDQTDRSIVEETWVFALAKS